MGCLLEQYSRSLVSVKFTLLLTARGNFGYLSGTINGDRLARSWAEGARAARDHGVSEATICAWKAKYGGLEVSDAQRLRQAEDGNGPW